MRSTIRHGLFISVTLIGLFFASGLNSYAETVNYFYDELNRLIRVEYPDGTKIIYSYDKVGNRSQVYVGQYVTLTVNVVGSGTVTKNPDQPFYEAGTSVTLTAVDGSQTFSEWSGDLTGNTNPTTIPMDGDKSVTATFVTPGWLQGWTYRKAVTLSRPSGAVTNYPMRLLVGETSGASGEDIDCNGHVQPDFDDLRFTRSDGTTLLDYWIESITGSSPNKLAKVWIEFNSIGTGPTTFYMYYGKADATAVSSITATFLAGDNGVSGNFTEAKAGSATITHTGGKYKITEDSTDDAALMGRVLGDWNFYAHILEVQQGSGTAGGDTMRLTLFDEASLADCINGTSNIGIIRYVYGPDAHKIAVFYIDPGSTTYYWDGDSWTTTATRFSTSGNLEFRLWSDGTDIKADVLSGGTSIFSATASIGISNVRSFSNTTLAFGEGSTSSQRVTVSIDNYFVRKYLSPEPVWGSWGAEQAN